MTVAVSRPLAEALCELIASHVEQRIAELPRSFDSLRLIVAECSAAALYALSYAVGLMFDMAERDRLVDAAERDLRRMAHQRARELQATQNRFSLSRNGGR